MTRWTGIVAVTIALVAGYFFFAGQRFARVTPVPRTGPSPAPVAAVPASPSATRSAGTSVGALAENASAGPGPSTDLASRAGSPGAVVVESDAANLSPQTVLENMRSAIRLYGSTFGGNPVGNNAEITAALTGNNPKQIGFIRPDAGLRTSERGELVDPWGTPFFFHQQSGTETEIRSAGPDRILWTADDLVAK